MATRTANNKTYYINPAYLTFVENSGYGANLIQVSASSSCYISVYDPANGINYSDADKNYLRWKVTAYNNKFPDDDVEYPGWRGKWHIYVQLEVKGKSALVIYDQVLRGVHGGEIVEKTDDQGNVTKVEGEYDPDHAYYYIHIGEVGETDGTSIRSITYDTGYLESPKGQQDAGSLNDMWELDKYSTPWLIRAKQWLAGFTVKGFIKLVGGLIFSKGAEGDEKVITDIKRSTDSDEEFLLNEDGTQQLDKNGNPISDPTYVPINDETIPTTAWIDSKFAGVTDDKYLRKDQDDATEFQLGVGSLISEGDVSIAGNLIFQEKPIVEFTRHEDEEKPEEPTDDAIYSALMMEGRLEEELGKLDEKYLRKDQDDATPYQLGAGSLIVEREASIGSDATIGRNIIFQEKPITTFIRLYDDDIKFAHDAALYSALMTDTRIEEEIEKLDDRFLRKDVEDTAHKHITFEEGITVYQLAKTMNLEVKELATIARAVVDMVGSGTFVDGFAGEGYQIWKNIATGDWNMTLDRLTVRKTMNIYELILQKIRSVGGMIVVSAGNGKVKEVERVGIEYKFTFEDTNTFAVNDLIRCQVFSQNGLKHYWAEVSRVSGEYVYARVSDFGETVPEVGDECVLMGNTKNVLRQNFILISATEDGQPRFDCYDKVKSKSFEGCLRTRVGCLDGISDSRFPSDMQPNGYGLYADNCFLTGVFVLSNGKDVQTQLSVIEGTIRSEISSVRSEINAKDNYLYNASFSNDLEGWGYDNDVRVFNTSGGLLHFNGDFYSLKDNVAGITSYDSKSVLRIKESYITQKNETYNLHPSFDLYENEETGEEKYRPRMFYVSFKYMCIRGGTLRVYFNEELNDGTFEDYEPLRESVYISPTVTYTGKEVEGKWNGTGDFYLSFDGDIYIYDLSLSDNKLADVEEKFTMRFEATDKKVQANLDHVMGQLNEYHAEFTLTAKNLETKFTQKIRESEQETKTAYESAISASAKQLTSEYQTLVYNEKEKIESDYNSKFEQTSQKIAANVSSIESIGTRVQDNKSKLSVHDDEIAARVLQTTYNKKTGEIDGSISLLQQRAGSLETSVANIDKEIINMQDDLDAADKAIDDLDKYVKDFEDDMNEFMSDGVIDKAEAVAIGKYLNSLSVQMADINSTYEKIYGHKYLSGTPKTTLKSRKASLDTAYNNLVSAINTAIKDGLATSDEVSNVDSRFDAFDTAIDNYNDALEDARDAITGYFADQAVSLAENRLYDALPEDWKDKAGTYASALVQMAEGISTVSGYFDENGNLIEGAGWITESGGNTLWATKAEYNALGEIVGGHTAELKVQNDRITSEVGQIDKKLAEQLSKINEAEDAIDQVQDSVSDLDDYIDNAFKDSVVDEAETLAINEHLKTLETTIKGIDSTYEKVISNKALGGTSELSALTKAYNSLKTAYDSLVSIITNAIKDGKATDVEKQNVDEAFDDFNSALDKYNDALESARFKIGNYYADLAVKTAEDALFDALPDDYKDGGTYASAMVQMAEGISSVAARFDEEGRLSLAAGQLITAYGAKTWATQTEFDELGNVVEQNRADFDVTSKEISAKVTDLDGNYSSLSVRVGALESVVGDGAEDGDFEGFKSALNELTGKVTANTKAAAAAQDTADGATAAAAKNLTMINQTSNDIKALAGKIQTDADGNITNISLSGLVLDSEFASLFSTQVGAQGIAKTAQLSAYVLETELGDLVSTIDISADQINLTGVVTYTMLNTSLKNTLDGKATSSALQAAQKELNNSIGELTDTIDGLQSEVNLKASTESLNAKVSDLNTALKGKASTTLEDAVINGSTLIVGGYINADLIQAGSLVIGDKKLSDIKGLAWLDTITSEKVTDLGDLATQDYVYKIDFSSDAKSWIEGIGDTAEANLDALKGSLKALAYQELVRDAMEKETIIVDGYINTSLIDASAIRISGTQVTGLGALAFASSVAIENVSGAGALATYDNVLNAMQGDTVAIGGFIQTEMIDVGLLTVNKLQATSGEYTYTLDSDGFVFKEGAVTRMEINVDLYPFMRISNSIGDVTIAPDSLMVTSGSYLTTISAEGINLFYSKTGISGLKVGNINSYGLYGNTDFLVMSSSHSLPEPPLNKGKIIFIRFVGNRTLTGSIIPRNGGSVVSSVTHSDKSAFYISNGTYWYEFFCYYN